MYVYIIYKLHDYIDMTEQLPRLTGWTLTAVVKLALASKNLRRVLAIIALNQFNATVQPGFIQDSPKVELVTIKGHANCRFFVPRFVAAILDLQVGLLSETSETLILSGSSRLVHIFQ